MKRLVIDLGHGGHDPGAIGPNKTHESDIVLAIGKELNELLKGYELEVKFTRLSNVYLSLSERAKIANDFKADYFYQFTLIQLQIAVLEVLKFGSILIKMIS